MIITTGNEPDEWHIARIANVEMAYSKADPTTPVARVSFRLLQPIILQGVVTDTAFRIYSGAPKALPFLRRLLEAIEAPGVYALPDDRILDRYLRVLIGPDPFNGKVYIRVKDVKPINAPILEKRGFVIPDDLWIFEASEEE